MNQRPQTTTSQAPRRLALACAVALGLVTTHAAADSEEATANLAQFAQIAGGLQGFSPRGELWRGQLTPGEATLVTETLMLGNEYLILAAGDAAATDINLELFDADLAPIDADLGPDNSPVLTVAPPATGTYHIRVTLVSASAPAAWYALQVMYR